MTRGEELMEQWDGVRRAIADGCASSWPRDWFESLIDVRDARIAELEAALRKINALNDNPARFSADIQAVLDAVIDTADTKFI